MEHLSRRGLITGLVALVTAPTIVLASSLMPVKLVDPEWLVVKRVTIRGIIHVEYKIIPLTDKDRAEMQDAQAAALALPTDVAIIEEEEKWRIKNIALYNEQKEPINDSKQ